MQNQFHRFTKSISIKPLLKVFVAIALVVTLVFSQADGALAARGGRIGGGSFRAPSRTYSPAPRSYAPRGGGYYPGGGYGGGYGLPFVFSPFFWIGGGGGGLFTLLIFLAVAGFLVNTFRRVRSDDGLDGYDAESPKISVAKLQVGLLAEARELQGDLDRIAQTANTGSTAGLAQVLQETSLALLRHPEYWIYGGSTIQQARLQSAEAEFNRLSLAERSKFTGETLSNVNNQLKQANPAGTLMPADKSSALANQTPDGPGEYILVTLLVASQGNLQLPTVNSSEDMRRALQQLGGVSSDRLLALEVLWTPQAEGDVLTNEDLLVGYPDLKLI